jgi:putative inorganic carbon (HCO3(-)) transporter
MSRSSGFGFFLFIVLNATLFVRPHELVSSLVELPIYNAIILACLAVSAITVLGQLAPGSLANRPVSACAVCLLASVVLADLSHFRFRDAIISGTEIVKLLIYFFLLVGLLDSFARFRKFLVWLCVFVMVVASLALLHYYHIVNIPTLEAYHERQEDQIDEETGEAVVLARLQATGIYGNPNDLSRILVIGILLSLYFLGDRRRSLHRWFWLLPIALFGQSLHLTHSRGGLLSLFAGLGALFYSRYGRSKTLLLGVLMLVPLLVLFGGRQTNFTTSEGTGQLRIKIWNEAFVLLQGSPVLGIGMNQFGEHHRVQCHNSFVTCYVDLGFVGGTSFFALFYLPFRALRSRTQGDPRDQFDPQDLDPEVTRLRPFVFAIAVATVVGMLSSTRSYSIPTYLIVGLCAAYLRIISDQGRALLPRFNLNLVGQLMVPSAVTLVALYTYVRLSAHY